MKSFNILFSVFQVIIGISGLAAFVVLCVNGAFEIKWLFTALLAAAFLAVGAKGLAEAAKK